MIIQFYKRIKSKYIKPLFFSGSEKYWINRYQSGGNSGAGSYGKFAQFKAEIINDFLQKHEVKNVIEFGCGDGNQLKLINYPEYLGLDVSPVCIKICKKNFEHKDSFKFKHLDEYKNEKADLTLSLDVLFHLVEDNVFESYLENLFKASEKYVIIYSSNDYLTEHKTEIHVKHRKFTNWIENNISSFRLIKHIPNIYPFKGIVNEGSPADFFIYKKN